MQLADMNIDWSSALVGALVGWLLGFAFDRLVNWSRRVKVSVIKFDSVPTNFGILYKMRFKLKGYDNPGECSCEFASGLHTTFAKWDEAPNPLRNDRLDAFVPEMVPATVHRRLHVGREYSVPMLVKDNSQFYIFDGWWFGRKVGYYKLPPLKQESMVSVTLRGNSFAWTQSFVVKDIVGSN